MIFKVLCDVHIAFKVVKFFEEQGYEAIHVNNILDSYYTKDTAISHYADQHGFIVVTKDIDFKDSHFLQNTPSRLLHITLGNIPTKNLIAILDRNLTEIVKHFDTEKCFIELASDYIHVIK